MAFILHGSRTCCRTLLSVKLPVRHFRTTAALTSNILKSQFPDVNIPEKTSFTEGIFQHFDKYTEKIALVNGVTGDSYSYKQLKTNVHKIGSGLTRLGFKKGDVFAIYAPNIPEYVILFHGIVNIGGIVTTVNPLSTTYELARQLKQTSAKFLITIPALADKAKEAASQNEIESVYVFGQAEGCLPYDSLLNNDGLDFPKNLNLNPKEDILILPCSSGTTGLPKAVMLTHHNVLSNTIQCTSNRLLTHSKDTVIIGFLPIFHLYGMFMFSAISLLQGSKVILMPQFIPELFLKNIQDYKVTIAPIVPPVALFLNKDPIVEKYNLSSIKEFLSAAAPLGKEIAVELGEKYPFAKVVRQGYGMTELGPASHIDVDDHPRNGSVGLIVPNTECKVIDISSGNPLGPKESGEVCVRGPQVMKGYLNNPEATADTIDNDGWLHTGDIGYYDEDGYFYIVERLKELIKYKAFQVPPAELEDLLLTHPNIRDAAVIGVKDSQSGEVPKAFVVRTGDVTEIEIQEFVAEKVSSYKKLRGGVEFIDEIPKAASGKILRRNLREREMKKSHSSA